MDRRNYEYALNDLGLPARLVDMIEFGTLFDKIDAAYRTYDKSVALLDAWEAANPAAAPLAPWFKAREAWKGAGRPKPEWYEVLWMQQNLRVPIKKTEIAQKLLPHNTWRNKQRAARKAGLATPARPVAPGDPITG